MAAIKILAGINFSDCSINAINYVIEMEKKQNCQIRLVYCYPDFVDTADLENSDSNATSQLKKEDIVNSYLSKLNTLKTNIENKLTEKEANNINIEVKLLHGYPEDILKNEATEMQPNIIVLGASIKNNSIRELMGTITSDLIHKTAAPIISIPSLAQPIQKKETDILYLTDFRSSDFESLHRLIKFIAPPQTMVHCVHFCHTKPDKYDDMRMENLQTYCNETYRNHQFCCEVIIGDNMVDRIDQFIKETGIDIIAITRVKRNMISKLLHPDISKKLLFHSHIPLIVFNE